MKTKKRIVSILVLVVFSLSIVSFAFAQGDTVATPNAKSIIEKIVNSLAQNNQGTNAADAIALYLNSGKSDILTAFNTVASGGREVRLEQSFGLTTASVSAMIDFMKNTYVKSDLIDLIDAKKNNASNYDSLKTNLANQLIEQYKTYLNNDINRVNTILDKINTYLAVSSFSPYKPISYDSTTKNFTLDNAKVDQMINFLNDILGDDISADSSKTAIKTALQGLVSSINTKMNDNQKLGANLILDFWGLLYTTTGGSTGGNTGGSTGGTTTGSTGTTTGGTTTTTPTTPTNIQEAKAQLQEAAKSGDVKTAANAITQTLNVIETKVTGTTQQEILTKVNAAIDVAKEASKTLAAVITKTTTPEEVKSLVTSTLDVWNKVSTSITNADNLSTVQKTEITEKSKFELMNTMLSAIKNIAVIPAVTESESENSYTVSTDKLTAADAKLSAVYQAFSNIKTAENQKVISLIGNALMVNAVTDKDKKLTINFDEAAVNKVKSEGKYSSVAVATKYGYALVPLSNISGGKLSIEITKTTVNAQNNISDVIDIKVNVNGNNIDTFTTNPVKLVFNLNNKPQDPAVVTAFKVNGDTTEIVPGIYVESTNSFIALRKSLSTYYVGTYTKNFKDVSASAWYTSYVKEAVAKGIVSGYPDTTFRPDNSVTRAEFAKMIVQALGISTKDQSVTQFSDVTEKDWFYPYVAALYNLGVVNGRSANKFAPNEKITREEMAKVVSLALVKTGKISDANITTTTFADNSNISSWAKKYVALAQKNGILEGMSDNKFDPKSNTTRAQVAAIALRAFIK
ncbi:S-layer homology domain-containing protein [Caldicellulosiruptoraceae bacterium PP1]